MERAQMNLFSAWSRPLIRVAGTVALFIGILASPALLAQTAGQDIPEAEVHAEYDRFVAAVGTTDYHVAHIMLGTEDRAREVINRIQRGESFAQLARKYSLDPPSAKQGGDLGWNTPPSFDPVFSDAMVKLTPGEYSARPVHTRFGWHIIEVIETRPAQIPPFEQVEWQIRNKLSRQQPNTAY
jgi:peptidyl-prolyl cis-trans isomerase C